MLGWASLLHAGHFEPERLPKIHDSIFRNAQAQAQIINDLLDISRIVTGHLQLQLQDVDLCDVARAGLEAVRPTARLKDVALETDFSSAPCRVSGDPSRLQQVIWNLLANAVKFTPPGGTVTLTVGPTDSTVTLAVRDTGIGIPAAFLPHVFERF